MTFVARVLAAALSLASAAAFARDVQVAVASNFAAPMQKIAAAFEQDTGHRARLSIGSTGRFYSQIANGAPFEVLLAGDDETPEKLVEDKLGVAGSAFTYATGRLVLWSSQAGFVDGAGDVLRSGKIQKLAVADPKLAPYGLAAMEVLTTMKLETLEPRLVRGESIAQAYQFVATGNAQAGFVALSQVMQDGKLTTQGSAWVVPAELHGPIRQDAVLLTRGKDNIAAQSLMVYLHTERVKDILRSFGYQP